MPVGFRKEGVPAPTDLDIECPEEIIAIEWAAGRAPFDATKLGPAIPPRAYPPPPIFIIKGKRNYGS
jgi:hypothetical protein